MPHVELIYDSDCPNVPRARENLLRAFHQAGITPRWQEWDRSDTAAPARVLSFGSPTVLVEGRDVAGTAPSDAACCRIYRGAWGENPGAPPVTLIAAALGGPSGARNPRRGFFPLIPAMGTALAPKLVCPACWPAYAGLLSALGLGFINYGPFLLPLTIIFLAAVLITLAWRARGRRGYAPLTLGTLAAAIILAGKFRFDSEVTTYIGVALLVGASLWNAWPRRIPICSECLPDGTKSTIA